MESLVPSRLATLGHPHRLAIFRLLMRRYPDRVPAGELASALGLKASTLSAYLASLMQAGLVTQERAGTSLRYAIDMAQTQQTMGYLLLDCCRGRPELCAPDANPQALSPEAATGRKHRVLFICTGNATRSLLAEAILRAQAGERFDVWSAGTRPRSAPNPAALALLADLGHDITPLRPKALDRFRTPQTPAFDFVFTVCDQAANEDCPAWAGSPFGAHWGVPAPACPDALRPTHDTLRARIRAFTALPIAALDRLSLQRALDDIGRLTTGDPA